ncbi:MAG: hypothetical protein NVSMB31_04130 [Vulcanimicrobiaceae bacterium]
MKRFHAFFYPVMASAALILSGCGGGGGSAVPGGPGIPSKQAASAVFQISIPLAQAQTGSKLPQYVSPNTQSVSISLVSVNGSSVGGSPTVANLSATAPGCTQSGGVLSCAVPVPAQVGSDVYSVSMFAGLNASGATLSAGQTTATIVAGILNPVPVTLNGVVNTIAVTLANATPTTGTAQDIPVTVTAKDPTGATIVGPGNYNSPITLSDTDTSGATSLSATSVTAPGASVTLHYTGSSSLTSATISASASGVPPASVTSAVLRPGGSSGVATIASGSGALAIFTNSAGQTYAYLPSPLGLTQVLVSSGSTLGSSSLRHPSSTGSGTLTLTPSPDACATDPVHVRLYCVAYSSAVVNVLDIKSVPATVIATYTTDASGSLSFTGGTCQICGAAYDAADDGVLIATAKGYELYGAPPSNSLLKTIAAPVSENFGYNPVTNQVWSPHYPGSGTTTGFDLADVKTGKLYTLTPSPTGLDEPDQGAVDNQTNIGITSQEFANIVYLLPFSLATLDSPAAGQFADPFGQVTLTSTLSSTCSTMLDDLAVDSQAHLAFFTGEFCSPGPVGVAQLPSTSSASPSVSDWNFANVPVAPNGVPWDEAHDPHAVATFNVPPICSDCGAIFNLDRSYLAVVDLKKLLAAPRDSTDTHLVAASYDLICNSIITFIATDATKNGNSGCAAQSVTLNAAGGTFTSPSVAGFVVNTTYPPSGGGSIALAGSTEPFAGVTIPSGASGTPVLYLSLTPPSSVTFTSGGFAIQTITVPAWFPTGKIYNYYAFDTTSGVYCGFNGPGVLTGNTLDFSHSAGGVGSGTVSGSGCTGPGNQTVPANHKMVVVLTYQ